MHANPIVKIRNYILEGRESKKKAKISKLIGIHIIKMQNMSITRDIVLIGDIPYYVQFGRDIFINQPSTENMISRLSDAIDNDDSIPGQHINANVYKMTCKDLSADRFLHSSINKYSIISLTVHHRKSNMIEFLNLQDFSQMLRLEVEIQTDMAKFNCVYKLNEKQEFVMFKYDEIIPNNKGGINYVG